LEVLVFRQGEPCFGDVFPFEETLGVRGG
jgi:hypothetical protein